jgi:hypothetical protein
MMVTCVYVGGESSAIGDREFDAIGQKAVFSEKGFGEVLLGGAAFIPQKMFDGIGFTEEELGEYGPIGSRYDPPQSFCDKLATAQHFFHELRSELASGKQPEDVLASIDDVGELAAT